MLVLFFVLFLCFCFFVVWGFLVGRAGAAAVEVVEEEEGLLTNNE